MTSDLAFDAELQWATRWMAAASDDIGLISAALRSVSASSQLQQLAERTLALGERALADEATNAAAVSLVLADVLALASQTSVDGAASWLDASLEDQEVDIRVIQADVAAALSGDLAASARAAALVALVSAESVLSGAGLRPDLAELFAAACVSVTQFGWARFGAWRTFADRLLILAAVDDSPISEQLQDTSFWFSRYVRAEATDQGDLEACIVAVDAVGRIAGRIDDLDGATQAEHHLHHSAAALSSWRLGGPSENLRVARSAAETAVRLANADQAALYKDVLARVLSASADASRDIDMRRAAISTWRAAVEALDPSDSHADRLQVNLASELALLARWESDPTLLAESITMYETLRRRSGESDFQAAVLTGLATRYRQRYDLTSDRQNLIDSIAVGQEAIDASTGAMQRSTALNNQGTRLRRQFEDFAHSNDIAEAIKLHHQAIAELPPGRREHGAWVANLVQCYRLSYEAFGHREDRVLSRWWSRSAARGQTSDATINSHNVVALADTNVSIELLRAVETDAREALSLAPPGEGTRTALANLAGVLSKLAEATGEPNLAFEALRKWEAAIELTSADHIDSPGLSTGVGATYEVLADLLGDPTMLDDAVTNHRQALSVLDSRGQIGQVRTIVATNLANALARLSDVTADIQFCTEAIDLAERSAIDAGGGTVAYGALLAAGGAALTRFQLSIDHTGAGRSVDARKAIDFYREAVDRVSSDPLESPRAIGNLANALFSVGTALGQADMLHEAADLYERATVGGDDYALIQRLVNYAFVALSLAESTGNAEERTSNALAAEALFEDAVALASQNSTTSPLSRLRIQAGLIRSSALQGLWKKTAHYAEKGSEVLSEMASGPNPRLGGDTSLQAVSNLSGLGAAAHLRIGDFDAAIGLIEQTQAVHLRERIGQDALTVELAGRGHINLANELRSALRMERSTRSQGGHTYRSESRATALLIRAAHEALGSSDVSRAEEAFRTASDLGHPVVYLLGDYQTGYLLRLDPDGSTAIESADELSSSRIGRLSARFGRAVNNARTPATRIELRHVVNDVISELTKVAAGPLRDLGVHGGQSRLIPIGPFRGLPWHAVAIDGVPLIGHVPVSYLPSASLSHSSTRRQPGTGAVIIGQPTVDLPGVQPEVEAITEALEAADVDVLDLNGNESRSALLQAISDSRFLHVASHTNEQWSAGTSTLAISPTRTLAAADLLEIGLKAELTVLSACSTNRPDLLYPDGSVTLASVAYLAGSKAVLSTLWPVVDQWISETAPNVYERLLAGDDLPEALALSLQPHLHNEPYLWAPLHVIG